MRRAQPGNNRDVNLKQQLIDFWNKCGLFSRFCFIANVAVYIYQLVTKLDLKDSAICLGPIHDSF